MQINNALEFIQKIFKNRFDLVVIVDSNTNNEYEAEDLSIRQLKSYVNYQSIGYDCGVFKLFYESEEEIENTSHQDNKPKRHRRTKEEMQTAKEEEFMNKPVEEPKNEEKEKEKESDQLDDISVFDLFS